MLEMLSRLGLRAHRGHRESGRAEVPAVMQGLEGRALLSAWGNLEAASAFDLRVDPSLAAAVAPAGVAASPNAPLVADTDFSFVTASFSSTAGSVTTTVNLSLSVGKETEHVPPAESDTFISGFSMAVQQQDAATGNTTLFIAQGAPPVSGMKVSGGGATLDGTVPAMKVTFAADGSLTGVTDTSLSIHLTWRGVGPPEAFNLQSHFPGAIFGVHGSFRQASASGRVAEGATNFTPLASTSAAFGGNANHAVIQQ